MRANFGFIAASFMLIGSVFALPLEADVEAVEPSNKNTAAMSGRPTPNCRERALVDICLTDPIKTGSRCDAGGNFESKVGACTFPACWCE